MVLNYNLGSLGLKKELEMDLPYQMPKSDNEHLLKLAKITGIPANLLVGGGETEIAAISYMILYRHLNQHDRIEAMRIIKSVKNRQLMGHIIDKTLLTTFVTTQWGVWSLSNKELLAEHEFYESISSMASVMGVGASALGGFDMMQEARRNKRILIRHWALIVLWGCWGANEVRFSNTKKELRRRQVLKPSSHY